MNLLGKSKVQPQSNEPPNEDPKDLKYNLMGDDEDEEYLEDLEERYENFPTSNQQNIPKNPTREQLKKLKLRKLALKTELRNQLTSGKIGQKEYNKAIAVIDTTTGGRKFRKSRKGGRKSRKGCRKSRKSRRK